MQMRNTVWAADFENTSGQQHFILFLGQHWQKEKINKVCKLEFQSLPSIQYV
jgi:hypothetical protein